MDSLLDIPAFLIRKKRRGRPRKYPVSVLENEPARHKEWNEIKKQKYGTRYDIQLTDEFPRIGSGRRIIYVTEKRKWAHIVSQTGNPETTEKIKYRVLMPTWLTMKKAHEKYVKRNTKNENNSGRAKRIRRHA